MSQYLFCKENNKRLEFNDTVVCFFSLVSKKEVICMAIGEVEAMYFFAKYTLNLPHIYPIFSSKEILFSYIIFVKSGLTRWICFDVNFSFETDISTILKYFVFVIL